jgi:anti-anti-sigma factor
MLNIELKHEADSVTVEMGGKLVFSTIATCLPVMNKIKQITAKSYIADLGSLTTIDSSGLGMLISIRNSATRCQGAFIIRGAHGQVAETLKAARFDLLATVE